MISRDIRRKFGQNYLSDPAIIFEMGQAISPQTNSNFFEIGPGMGALTNVLNQDGVSCLLYTSPSPRDRSLSRMPSSA